jgi:hypothetical protein
MIAWCTRALTSRQLWPRRGQDVCAMNTTASPSCGSTQNVVPKAPGQAKSPGLPSTGGPPAEGRTATVSPKP